MGKKIQIEEDKVCSQRISFVLLFSLRSQDNKNNQIDTFLLPKARLLLHKHCHFDAAD